LKTSVVVLFFLLFAGCKSNHQFSIEGTINVEERDTWIYLHELWAELPIIDSVPIENGCFRFTGIIQDPEIYALSIPALTREACTFILEPAKLMVHFDSKQLYNDGTKVSGGPINEEFNREQKYQEETYYSVLKSLYSEGPVDEEHQRVIGDKIMELGRVNSNYVYSFIRDNPGSPVSMYLLIWWYYQRTLDELHEVVFAFSPKLRLSSNFKRVESDFNTQVSLNEDIQAVDLKRDSTNQRWNERKILF
jgi:hypothetical protein